ncbi:hypothetical protein HLRTI_000382 [Halorhabdus tiamatea SARL4B]|uniref:Uncharacterized protein n=2 Tax=Halorhabdus tiamatea SARL4B TaxID=1033806 RepID=U2FHF7_9EURY|nr:hypothetical protein [Halorhabdus tiamatea]ERJ07629.1 hypothetical protein HLRTI_000382 [Halorhabdus tiamatea SARL4B]
MDRRLLFMAILVGGVVGFGLADYALTSAGYGTAGMVVWGGGYLATMFVVWYGWVRHLDMTGI